MPEASPSVNHLSLKRYSAQSSPAGPSLPTASRHNRQSSSQSLMNFEESHITALNSTIVASHANAVELITASLPPSTTPGSTFDHSTVTLDGLGISADLEGSEDEDLDTEAANGDRIRAPTRSSLNKMRARAVLPHSSPSFDLRKRAITETPQRATDERLELSRIPRAAVTHAVSLHTPSPVAAPRSQNRRDSISPSGPATPDQLLSPLAFSPHTSPLARTRESFSLTSDSPGAVSNRSAPGSTGKSSRMIDALQTELDNAKSHLDRVKQEVRNCRREIGTLTRKSEDLRETRDRMRSEADTLNNVISRKERMITDVLSRARTAEAALAQHASERKELEAKTKRSVSEARTEAAEAVAARMKAESERDALRDSVRSLRDVWTRDVGSYRDEVKRVIAQNRREKEDFIAKQKALLDLIRAQTNDRQAVVAIVDEMNAKRQQEAEGFEEKIKDLHTEVVRSSRQAAEAQHLAESLSSELSRMRRHALEFTDTLHTNANEDDPQANIQASS